MHLLITHPTHTHCFQCYNWCPKQLFSFSLTNKENYFIKAISSKALKSFSWVQSQITISKQNIQMTTEETMCSCLLKHRVCKYSMKKIIYLTTPNPGQPRSSIYTRLPVLLTSCSNSSLSCSVLVNTGIFIFKQSTK